MSLLWEFLLPQDDIDEDDETEESDEDEQDDILAAVTAMDGSKLVVVPIIRDEDAAVDGSTVVEAKLDDAVLSRKSNSSSKPVMGDH